MLQFGKNFNKKLSKFSRILQQKNVEMEKINYFVKNIVGVKYWRLDSNIESKSSKNTFIR